LIDEFRRLPGVGQKSAQRLAFYVLRSSRDQAAALAAALIDVKDNLGICAECNNISDAELCPYCRDPNRDRTRICVVEEPHNILAVETTRSSTVCITCCGDHSCGIGGTVEDQAAVAYRTGDVRNHHGD
jgi:recombination protein RecR